MRRGRGRNRPVVIAPRRGPVVVAPRRGPGLLGTMARTAVVAGTATAVSRGVSNAMNASAQQAAAMQQAQIDAAVQQQMSAQQAGMQPAPAEAPSNDVMSQLQQLVQMKQAGFLTDEEFAAAKAKLLTGS